MRPCQELPRACLQTLPQRIPPRRILNDPFIDHRNHRRNKHARSARRNGIDTHSQSQLIRIPHPRLPLLTHRFSRLLPRHRRLRQRRKHSREFRFRQRRRSPVHVCLLSSALNSRMNRTFRPLLFLFLCQYRRRRDAQGFSLLSRSFFARPHCSFLL